MIHPLLESNPYLLKSLDEILLSREKNRRQNTWICRPLSDFHPSAWDHGRVENPDPVVVYAQRLGSYTLLPHDYPPIISTGRSETGKKELNDNWFTVAKGSEDLPTKNMRNLHEDALFKCEDERFELDCAINNFESCIDFLGFLYSQAQNAQNEGLEYELTEKTLRSPKLKPIYKMYGEYGQMMIQKLEADPLSAIPMLLSRAKQVYDYLLRKRTDQNKIWKEVCEKNYHKSLDHKACNFKHYERKLTVKNYVTEIKERYNKRHRASLNIKLGGNENSRYFNSLPSLQPEDYHINIIENDSLSKLSNEYFFTLNNKKIIKRN